jgi:hypothetical protein
MVREHGTRYISARRSRRRVRACMCACGGGCTCISLGKVAENMRVWREPVGGMLSCSTIRRIWGSKPISNIRSASSRIRNLTKAWFTNSVGIVQHYHTTIVRPHANRMQCYTTSGSQTIVTVVWLAACSFTFTLLTVTTAIAAAFTNCCTCTTG